MPDEQTTEPQWVQRMRAAGYNVRIGSNGEPMSEVPDASFTPPPKPTVAERMRRFLRVARQFAP